jgi:hypothetical protein
MQFAIDSNSTSLLELLYTVQKDMITKKSGNKFLCWICGRNLSEVCNVQCNTALILVLIMYYILLLLLYYFNNIGLQVSPSYKSQHCRFSLIDRYVPCNMILMDSFLFCIMWKIYSVPCDSTLSKFYCI